MWDFTRKNEENALDRVSRQSFKRSLNKSWCFSIYYDIVRVLSISCLDHNLKNRYFHLSWLKGFWKTMTGYKYFKCDIAIFLSKEIYYILVLILVLIRNTKVISLLHLSSVS